MKTRTESSKLKEQQQQQHTPPINTKVWINNVYNTSGRFTSKDYEKLEEHGM